MPSKRYPVANPLVLIRGMPGSGKSTLGLSLARKHGLVFLESDYFFETQDNGYVPNKQKLPEAYNWVRRAAARNILRQGVVVTGVFATVGSFDFFKSLTTDFTVIECTDFFGMVHDVSEASLSYMKTAWQPYADAIKYSYANQVLKG